MANPALIAKAAAIILTDEKAQKAVGWTLVAILSPLILLIAFLCSLGSGATEHNITAVELCFYDTIGIPAETPEEYRLCIEAMRASFAQLDIAIAAINENTEEETRGCKESPPAKKVAAVSKKRGSRYGFVI